MKPLITKTTILLSSVLFSCIFLSSLFLNSAYSQETPKIQEIDTIELRPDAQTINELSIEEQWIHFLNLTDQMKERVESVLEATEDDNYFLITADVEALILLNSTLSEVILELSTHFYNPLSTDSYISDLGTYKVTQCRPQLDKIALFDFVSVDVMIGQDLVSPIKKNIRGFISCERMRLQLQMDVVASFFNLGSLACGYGSLDGDIDQGIHTVIAAYINEIIMGEDCESLRLQILPERAKNNYFTISQGLEQSLPFASSLSSSDRPSVREIFKLGFGLENELVPMKQSLESLNSVRELLEGSAETIN